MVENIPYFPDAFREVVNRVSAKINSTYGFEVLLKYGIHAQVHHDLIFQTIDKPVIWLIMPYVEDIGRVRGYYSNVNCQVLICMRTDDNYTMEQRTDQVFKPYLIPVYKQLLSELKDDSLLNINADIAPHKRIDRPYWGGGESHHQNTPNLFKTMIDAIELRQLNLQLNFLINQTCKSVFKSF